MNFKRKLWWAQHRTDVYKYSTIVLLILIVSISIIYFTRSKFSSSNEMTMYETTVEPFIKNDYFIASYIDGEWSNEIPGKDDGYIVDKIVCDNGAVGTWDNDKWAITIENATKKIKCGVYFEKMITLYFPDAGTYTERKKTTVKELIEKYPNTFCDFNGYLSSEDGSGHGYTVLRMKEGFSCPNDYKGYLFDDNEVIDINVDFTFQDIYNLINGKYSIPTGGCDCNNLPEAYIYHNFCLSPNTEIEVYDEEDKKRKKKKLKDLKVGDKVICVNPYTGELEIDEVTYTDYLENKHHNKYDKWYFSDGTIIETVHRHRFYNIEKHDYTYMDEWIVGEHGYNIDGEIIELVKHEEINEDIRHCTLFTKKYNNYFANGMLSGNRHSTKIKFM